MEKVQQESPKVSVEIVVSLTPDLQDAVRTGELDMALLGPINLPLNVLNERFVILN